LNNHPGGCRIIGYQNRAHLIPPCLKKYWNFSD